MMWDEVLDGGGGVVLLSPGGDEGPEGRVGGEDAVVAVAVDPGWGREVGETVQELQGGQVGGGATGGIGGGKDVEDLVGALADEVEAVESEGWPSAEPNQTLEAGAVRCLDADAGVETEPGRPDRVEDRQGVRPAHEPKASNPPPWSQMSMSAASWGSRRPWRRK